MGEAALIVDFPFLGVPPLSWIWEFFASRLEQKVVAELQKGSTTVIITLTDDRQNDAAKAAASQLEKEPTDENFQDFKKKYGDLIRTRVSTPT